MLNWERTITSMRRFIVASSRELCADWGGTAWALQPAIRQMARRLDIMRFRDKLKSSREKFTPAAPDLVAGGMVQAECLRSGRAGGRKATAGVQNSERAREGFCPVLFERVL